MVNSSNQTFYFFFCFVILFVAFLVVVACHSSVSVCLWFLLFETFLWVYNGVFSLWLCIKLNILYSQTFGVWRRLNDIFLLFCSTGFQPVNIVDMIKLCKVCQDLFNQKFDAFHSSLFYEFVAI